MGMGSDPWAIQLIQHDIPLQQGRTYAVEFTAWADANRSINVALTRDSGSFDSYGGETFPITREPTSYGFTFTMTASTDSAARLVVEMGTSDINLKLSDFTLVER